MRDNAHSTTITMMIHWSDLHSRTPPHTWPLRASYGVYFVSYAKNEEIWPPYLERTVKGSDNITTADETKQTRVHIFWDVKYPDDGIHNKRIL